MRAARQQRATILNVAEVKRAQLQVLYSSAVNSKDAMGATTRGVWLANTNRDTHARLLYNALLPSKRILCLGTTRHLLFYDVPLRFLPPPSPSSFPRPHGDARVSTQPASSRN